MSGTEWRVGRFDRVVDGDTIRCVRSSIQKLGDDPFVITDVEPVAIRLVWVDTPERGHDGYREARADLQAWVDAHLYAAGPLRVYCYDGGAGWDRLLGDLIDADGNSASEYLMREKGWPAYVKGA